MLCEEVDTYNPSSCHNTAIIARIKNDNCFAKELLKEAARLFLSGEADTSRIILRNIINGTIGFETLATETSIPSKSLHRMLSLRGNPNMENISTIFKSISTHLQLRLTIDC